MRRWRKPRTSCPSNCGRACCKSCFRTSAWRRPLSSGSSGRSARSAPQVEDLALDRGPLQHDALPGRKLVEPSCQQGVDRGREDGDVAAVLHHCDHLLEEERVALCRLEDSPAHALVGGPASGPLQDPHRLFRGKWLEQRRGGVWSGAHPGGRSTRPGRARQSSRIGASRVQSAMCSTRSRKASSPQCTSSKRTISGVCNAAASSVFRTARKHRPPTTPRFGVRGGGDPRASNRVDSELLQPRRRFASRSWTSIDDRPERDAVAVGETLTPEDARAGERGEELVAETRLSDASGPEHREDGVSVRTPRVPRPLPAVFVRFPSR